VVCQLTSAQSENPEESHKRRSLWLSSYSISVSENQLQPEIKIDFEATVMERSSVPARLAPLVVTIPLVHPRDTLTPQDSSRAGMWKWSPRCVWLCSLAAQSSRASCACRSLPRPAFCSANIYQFFWINFEFFTIVF